MKTVWKYKIEPGRVSEIQMPQRSNILHVGAQGDDAYVWVLVDKDTPSITRKFLCVGTGDEFDEKVEFYHGTFFTGPVVFHVFELSS